jgi:uncharacterized linocin/CFP29 family protein
MTDYLAREDAPLTAGEWAAVDATVVDTARRMLVGRRILQVTGPLGVGIQDIDFNVFAADGMAMVSALGDEEDPHPIVPLRRVHAQVPMLYKDFTLFWRDLETARRVGMPIDAGAAAAAAAFVAMREDDLILNGDDGASQQGLLTANGAHAVDAGSWGEAGSAFRAVAAAVQTLLADGFYPPYAVVLNPVTYAQVQRVYANSGVLEVQHIRELAQGGVFQTQAIRHLPGLVYALGPQNADLAIAQDLITAYLGPVGMNHPFRVFETLVLRIKRPGAICVLNGPPPDPADVGGQ